MTRSHRSDGVDFELLLAVAAGRRSRVLWEAQAVEDGAECQGTHEEDCEMEVAELRHGCRVAVRMGDEAQGDGADGDTHAHAELHDGAEEAIRPAHPGGWYFRIGECGHAGELHGSAGSVEKEDDENEDGWRGGAECRAECHRCSRNCSIDDENAAEAEETKDLDHEGFHTQVSREERQQVEA